LQLVRYGILEELQRRLEDGLDGETGLTPDEFARKQKAVASLRNNLIQSVKDNE
jgi:hypothetical protein